MYGTIPLFMLAVFYWPNAQYLPFYIIDGERDGTPPESHEGHLQEQGNHNRRYAVTYAEYKGRRPNGIVRGNPEHARLDEEQETPYPVKEMAVRAIAAAWAKSFARPVHTTIASMAAHDDRPSMPEGHNSEDVAANFKPATFQAQFSPGNETASNKEAKIWNQFNVRVSGLKQVTLWITPNMMDFSKKVLVRANGEQIGPIIIQPQLETLLEELFSSGDHHAGRGENRHQVVDSIPPLPLAAWRFIQCQAASGNSSSRSFREVENRFAGIDADVGILIPQGAASTQESLSHRCAARTHRACPFPRRENRC